MSIKISFLTAYKVTVLTIIIIRHFLAFFCYHCYPILGWQKIPKYWPNGKSKILCSQNFQWKNGFVTIMVVGHFLGGFEAQNLFLDIFFCPFLKFSEKNPKSRPTSINALLCRGLRPLARTPLTVLYFILEFWFYAVTTLYFILRSVHKSDLLARKERIGEHPHRTERGRMGVQPPCMNPALGSGLFV